MHVWYCYLMSLCPVTLTVVTTWQDCPLRFTAFGQRVDSGGGIVRSVASQQLLEMLHACVFLVLWAYIHVRIGQCGHTSTSG